MPSSAAFTTTLSRAVSSGLKPTPSSMNGETRPATAIVPAVGLVDAGEALQHRALAGAVAADDAEELALVDLERDVAQRVQSVVAARDWRGCSTRCLSVDGRSCGRRNGLPDALGVAGTSVLHERKTVPQPPLEPPLDLDRGKDVLPGSVARLGSRAGNRRSTSVGGARYVVVAAFSSRRRLMTSRLTCRPVTRSDSPTAPSA